MRYCARCVYPENAKPYIIFDDHGICSGCRVAEAYSQVNWVERERQLHEILEKAKSDARANRAHYDCLIPVSGGKDSHFQAHIIKNIYGMNPLFVTYNHLFNAPLGLRNLENLFQRFSCDLLRFSSNPETVRKISRYMLERVGDITWHYHAGILTFPIQTAVRYKIPLIIWAENNFSNLVGTFHPQDMVEFSRKARRDLGMRGIDAEDLINPESGLTWQEISPFVYPNDDEIEGVGVRGIYLSNFIYWKEHEQALKMHEMYGFEPTRTPRERTFSRYSKLDDIHSNGVHDYLKYLKFGYGRATDDASTMIRAGLMSREEAIDLVAQYDHCRPNDLNGWLRFVNMSEDKFMTYVDPLRDPSIWSKKDSGRWEVLDSVCNHRNQGNVNGARLPRNDSVRSDFPVGKYDISDPRWLLEYDFYKYL